MGMGWRRLLFASDFSGASQAAVDEVILLAKRLEVEVTVANVHTSHWKTWISSRLEDRYRAERLELLAERLRAHGVTARSLLATEGDVRHGLVGLAEFERADLVVVGSSGKPPTPLRRSTAEHLVRRAKQPVWVSKALRSPPRHVLCGVDGSAASREALLVADALRRCLDVRLSAVHAVGNPAFNPFGLSRQEVERRTSAWRTTVEDEIRRFVETSGVTDVDVRFLWGDPAAVLCAVAEEEEVDLIVAGRTGKGGLRRMVLGSTAEQLLRRPCCSLLLLGEGHDPLFQPAVPWPNGPARNAHGTAP